MTRLSQTLAGALAPRDWASKAPMSPPLGFWALEVCSLRGSASSGRLYPMILEQLRWVRRSKMKQRQASAGVNQHQRLHPGRFSSDQEAREGQGQARPCLAAWPGLDVCDHQRQQRFGTGLGHLASVLDQYQSPRPPSQGTSHPRRLSSSLTHFKLLSVPVVCRLYVLVAPLNSPSGSKRGGPFE